MVSWANTVTERTVQARVTTAAMKMKRFISKEQRFDAMIPKTRTKRDVTIIFPSISPKARISDISAITALRIAPMRPESMIKPSKGNINLLSTQRTDAREHPEYLSKSDL